MKKRFIYLALIFAMVLSMATLAFAAGTKSSNINGHFYVNAQRWYKPVASHLAAEGNGYVRAEHINGQLVVERYDSSFNHLSTKTIDLELPIFGGVYMDDDYNFLVVGQDNEKEDDTKEVFRIIRYTKDWEKVDHTGLFGANTIHPFDGGSLRFDRCGDYLYIRTCHEMYTSDDGLNHQANVMIQLQVSTMTITDELSDVLNRHYGYISHSFNQFVRVDGTTLLAVDHGDALPRAVVLTRYPNAADEAGFFGRVEYVPVLPIADSTKHYNDTGVSVGGFEVSSTHYLVAGSAADMSTASTLYDDEVHRNIFITATDKNDFTEAGTSIHYLTSYAEDDDVLVSPPHFVKISNDEFFLIWTENGDLRWCMIDGSGQLVGDICSGAGDLSDCVPVLDGDRIVWYVTNHSDPVFYTIDLDDMGSLETPHTHTYDNDCDEDCNICGEKRTTTHMWDDGKVTKEPTCKDAGEKTYTCTVCGETKTEAIDKTTTHTYDNDCDEDCNICGEERTTTHKWDDGKVTKEPTCKDAGEKTYTCTVCGETKTEAIDKTTTHTYDNDCDEDCNICGKTRATSHMWDDGKVTKEPTCKDAGEKTYTCTVCGETRTQPVEKLSNHQWDEGTRDEMGNITYTCQVCGESTMEQAPNVPTEPTVPDEPTEPTVPPTLPTDPTVPATPTEPTKPAPTEPTPTVPSEPGTEPTAPQVKPSEPMGPAEPVQPISEAAMPIVIGGIVVACAFIAVLVVIRKKKL